MVLTPYERVKRCRDKKKAERAKKDHHNKLQNARRAKKREQNRLEAIMNDPNNENYEYNEPPGVQTPQSVDANRSLARLIQLTPQALAQLSPEARGRVMAQLNVRMERRTTFNNNTMNQLGAVAQMQNAAEDHHMLMVLAAEGVHLGTP